MFLGVGVTSRACPSHSLAQVPLMALCGIPVPSHQLGLPVLSWLPQVLFFSPLDPFFFSHQCSLFTPFCIWQSQEERRRRGKKRHKVCRGEKRGIIVNMCLSLAGGTAPPWDAGFPAPRAASLLCHRQRGLLRERPRCGGRLTSGSSHCTGRLVPG